MKLEDLNEFCPLCGKMIIETMTFGECSRRSCKPCEIEVFFNEDEAYQVAFRNFSILKSYEGKGYMFFSNYGEYLVFRTDHDEVREEDFDEIRKLALL